MVAKKPSSPIEISEQLQTSVSYVSQQLKLLEAANLVTKQKTGAVERGKPRTVYSLAKEVVHLTALINSYPLKKVIPLTDYHKIMLRIWLIENSNHHYFISKLYWGIEDLIDDVSAILIDTNSRKTKLVVISDSKKIMSRVELFLKQTNDSISCQIISLSDVNKLVMDDFFPIYDPDFICSDKKMKGGNLSNDS